MRRLFLEDLSFMRRSTKLHALSRWFILFLLSGLFASGAVPAQAAQPVATQPAAAPSVATQKGSFGNANPRIVIYTTNWCGYCKVLRAKLNRLKVPFTDFNISRSFIGSRTV